MPKTYHCTLEVRGYELDSYRHVNHAVYISYLEQARWKLLEEENMRLSDFDRWQRWPVIAQLEARYLKPSFLGDLLDIRTRVTECSRASITFEQEIVRVGSEGQRQAEEVPVLKATIRAVIVNEKGRPADMPPEMSSLWEGKAE